jgi:NADPH-dependent 2,4-dienoyl-CoA reductase/sulfur reductase-like enzyme/nitrite reductase/ring-hydroxylating ferredoxin subunit
MGGETKLTGPDLKEGVAAAELADDAMLVGHWDGEAVLVARSSGKLFAVGATCTHYSGPLGEGILVGDSVHCPWHHACFNLRTGEAEGPPALNALPCYEVTEQGGKLVVLGKRAAAERLGGNMPSHARASEAPREPVVILGAGAAGGAAAEMLRREGYGGKLIMIGREPTVPVDRPNLSKDYLAGTAPEEWMPLRSEDFYQEHGIELRRSVSARRIDLERRELVLENGEKAAFGALLIATGADPIRLDLPGAGLEHVHTLRTLSDSRAIIARAGSAKRAVVIGASFIGLEVAASLRTRDLEVHVVAPEARPLERVMGPVLGDFIRALHEEHGVHFHLGETATEIGPDTVTLKSGAVLPAQLVVVGIGVRPSVALAEAAGLPVENGILVDEYLETSARGVFAAGDVARFPDARTGQKLRIEHWAVAERQGQIAGRNMLGQRVPYNTVPFFWSQHYDISINYVGHAQSWDRIDAVGNPMDRDCALAFRKAGKTLAVASIFRDELSLRAEAAMQADDEEKLHRLIPAQ